LKKSIFKRWWFWLIVIVEVIIAISSGGGNNNNTAANPKSTQNAANVTPTPAPKEKDIWTKAGMYKVGKDILAGEYLLMADSSVPAYFQVSKDSTGSLNSIITNDNFEGSRYITLVNDQYFELRNAKFATIDKAPIQAPKDGVYGPGMYKIGRDIEPGEYKVKPQAGAMAYFEVAKDSKGSLDSIVTNDNFDTEKYVTIKENQYIKLNSCQLESK
jgi:hypothetical protein